MANTEEGRLLTRAQRGDLVAFEELVRMHQQRVFAHSYRLVGNAAEAEDLVSETFLRAFQHLQSLRADPSIIHWLLRVANNLGISVIRKRGTQPTVELEEMGERPSETPTPEEELLRGARRDVVRACLDQLPMKERAAVLMFYLEERPLEEIAKVLGCGLAGAKSRVHRARHKLKALVMAALGDTLPLGQEKGADYEDATN
ncbi:MAG TPA: sigma-70 family RNA polymerase sigma factor [Armatimonadota bacterium]|nr:sigma-70 family RNA polymerase sigma factor [Armatimonadota bacterium]